MDATKIYGGPLSKIELSSDGGTTWDDMGAIGNANAEILFDPKGYELGDGQEKQMYGLGSTKVELAETDSAKLALASAAKDSANSQLRMTALSGQIFTTTSALIMYKTTRGFGDDAHTLEITHKKKAIDADDYVTIT